MNDTCQFIHDELVCLQRKIKRVTSNTAMLSGPSLTGVTTSTSSHPAPLRHASLSSGVGRRGAPRPISAPAMARRQSMLSAQITLPQDVGEFKSAYVQQST
eukprot:m.21109 g.21109  ORF g.21109 m.21109 type:complete len:101 (-) comp8243_c0_seq2:899-1201(-)